MKNIAMMTVHQSINCGASLQASALYEALGRVGVNPCIINYCPTYFMPLTDYSNAKARRSPKGFIKTFLLGNRINKNTALFREYAEEYYPNITRRFDSLRDVDLACYNFDCYVCGSDQIWNPAHVHHDRAWFFDFVRDEESSLISYAASIGKNKLDDNDLEWLREGLGKFSRVGVREDSGVEIIKKLGIMATQNVDPTLLIERDEWRMREQEPVTKLPSRYILHYPIEPNPIEWQLLDALKRSLGLEVVTITDSLKYSLHADNCVSEYGPKQFLYLVDHAEAVLTNSFHGLVFSMIFGKKLVSFANMSKNSRLDSLFRLSGLEGYQVSDVKDFTTRDLDEEQERLTRAYATLAGPIEDSTHFLEGVKEL